MPQTHAILDTHIDPALLSAVQALAHHEGRALQSLVDEALSDLIEKHKQSQPRAHVMAAYQASHHTFADLYQQLAK